MNFPSLLAFLKTWQIKILIKGFSKLDDIKANELLEKVFRQYPSRYNNSNWRLNSRITSDNIDLILSKGLAKELEIMS